MPLTEQEKKEQQARTSNAVREILKNIDERILELEDRIDHLRRSKLDYAEALINYELNCADSAHRTCCGSTPRQLSLPGRRVCDKSPIGTCVYENRKDPFHKECLFCEQPEDK